MAQLNTKIGSTRQAAYKEGKFLKRGTFILGGAALVVVMAPMVFVMFSQVAGRDYIQSENERNREFAVAEGQMMLEAEVKE